ncbi:MAG: ABC transporter permease [Kofleriaceae bacterium]|nr:ABC transporter permease [Kofleriaceae bacterium]MCL4227848.1 ABC transporter permease [Myxococcales bacterium]
MPARNLWQMVLGNTVRSPRHFVFSAIGVVIGIGAFVFFLAGVLKVQGVLYSIFPLEEVEVIAPHTSIAGKNLSQKLTQETVDLIKTRPEVKEALPRMTLQFPAVGFGKFEGQDIRFEVGGFTDGIPHSVVADDPKIADRFLDGDAEGKIGPACEPERGKDACPDRAWQYCDKVDRMCHMRVPVIVSPTVLELYNTQVAESHGLPHIGAMEQFIAERGRERMHFTIGLGDTMVAGSNVAVSAKHREVGAILIGISRKAKRVGLTVPLGYVERWNREFAGEDKAKQFSSIIVTLRDKDRLATFTTWLQDEPKLKLEDSLGEQFGTVVFVITIVLLAISFVIVGISAINIAHNFFMQVTERRREIGVLRAVGASQRDVLMIVLGEAAVIGLVSGVLGSAAAFLGSLVVDWASAALVPAFPFKPRSWFDFEWWIFALAVGFSVLFCVVGGWLPARKAAQMEPAAALAQT